MIKITHLTKNYHVSPILLDINATINDGDIISIIGPSGCGKSTFLRCLCMLEKPTSGSVVIDGVDITLKENRNNPVRLKMGMVFQSFNLFPHMTVIENIMKPQVDILSRTKQEAYDKAMEVLHLVRMDGKVMSYPDSLSGGQKQRVAIARTLAMDPEIILFDEPTSALDPTMVQEVQSVISDLSKLGKTMLIVTHEMRFAEQICNRVFYLEQGIIYEQGTPEQIFHNPTKEHTRRFIRRLKVFETLIDSTDFDYSNAITEISRYAYKNQIDLKVSHKLESCFEELCQQIILPHLEHPLIQFCFEYDDITNSIAASVSYNGDNFNPLHSDNVLSLSILKNNAKKFKHTYITEDGFTNKFTFEIK